MKVSHKLCNKSFLSKLAAVGSSIVIALAGVSVAVAQDDDSANQPSEEIVVTGSLIMGTEASSHAVTTVDTEEIEFRGVTNAVELLEPITTNQPNITSATSFGAGTGFSSFVNLRSLGSENSLVLLGGKRLVRQSFQGRAVDLNTIPLGAIERIDVLSDGASSIYGTDAIAGVVNFILKEEVQGVSYNLTTQLPEEPGGDVYSGSVTAGLGSLDNDGWNFYVGATWREQQTIDSLDREFTKTAYLPHRGINYTHLVTYPANYTQGINTYNPSFPECNPPRSIVSPDGSPTCRFDPATQIDSYNYPDVSQQNVIAKFTGEVGDTTASVEYTWAKSDVIGLINFAPVRGITMPPESPFFPGAGMTPGVPGIDPTQPVNIGWRVTEAGPNGSSAVTETDRLMATVNGVVQGWGYEFWAMNSETSTVFHSIDGFPNQHLIRDGVAGANGAPWLNPFGPQTPEGDAFILANKVLGPLQRSDGRLTMAGFTIGNTLAELSAGPLEAAFAVEIQEDTVSFQNLPLAAETGQPALSSVNVNGARNAYSATGEVNVPVAPGLEISGSVRYDHYDGFGNTVNPKLLVNYDINDAVTVRASYNEGFRAPTLFNVFSPSGILHSLNRLNDPVLCPGGQVDLGAGGIPHRDCNKQFLNLAGGNQDLGPQESQAFTAGIVVRPTQNVRLSATYWDYELDGSIGSLAENTIFSDTEKYSNLIVRCSQLSQDSVFYNRTDTPDCFIPGGDPIAYVRLDLQNLGKTRTSGVDFTVDWRIASTGSGDFELGYRSTHVMDYDFQNEPGGPFFSRAGHWLNRVNPPVIEYSHYATLTWYRDRFSAQLQNRFLDGYQDCNAACGVAAQFANEVDSYQLWNLVATFNISDELVATARITNLLDEGPPYTNGSWNGYYREQHSILGRAAGITLTGQFGN